MKTLLPLFSSFMERLGVIRWTIDMQPPIYNRTLAVVLYGRMARSACLKMYSSVIAVRFFVSFSPTRA
jgi:hypothetical protein